MRIPRIYIDLPLQVNEEIDLPNIASHHINTVLRMRSGQYITVFNGSGGQYLAEITSTGKKTVVIQVREFKDLSVESPLHITLEQGISRGRHMDFTIQKAVELGANRIIPVITEYSNVKLDDNRHLKRQKHWQKIAISACEQSGRNVLPEISLAIDYMAHVRSNKAMHKFILVPEAKTTLEQVKEPVDQVSLLCGPEGGLSNSEVDIAMGNGYTPISVGPRILRTETAAMAAITASQVAWGDMG